jgi:hypothetical protein
MMRQCNTIDITRRSPSYEVRLSKYSFRNFEVQVPTLKRGDIDPTVITSKLMYLVPDSRPFFRSLNVQLLESLVSRDS